MWFLLVIIAVWFLVGWVIGLAAWIIGVTLAIPMTILMFTPMGKMMAATWRRSDDMLFHQLQAWQHGYGPPLTKKNTIRTLETWAYARKFFGDVAHEDEDIAWANSLRQDLIDEK